MRRGVCGQSSRQTSTPAAAGWTMGLADAFSLLSGVQVTHHLRSTSLAPASRAHAMLARLPLLAVCAQSAYFLPAPAQTVNYRDARGVWRRRRRLSADGGSLLSECEYPGSIGSERPWQPLRQRRRAAAIVPQCVRTSCADGACRALAGRIGCGRFSHEITRTRLGRARASCASSGSAPGV